MSKKDWALLGYLGYKSAKNEPGRFGNEIGKCLLGWIVLMFLGLVIYIIFTIVFDSPSFITSNLEIIKSLAIIIVMIIVIYYCYSFIIEGLGKHNKIKACAWKGNNKQDHIEHAKEVQHERLGEKSNYKRCPKCEMLVNKELTRCKYCKFIFDE